MTERQQDQLTPDEMQNEPRELWRGSFSAKAMLDKWIMLGSATIVVMLLMVCFSATRNAGWLWITVIVVLSASWIYFSALFWIRKFSCSYRLNETMLQYPSGTWNREWHELELIDIEDVRTVANGLAKFFKLGDIEIRVLRDPKDRKKKGRRSKSSLRKIYLRGIDEAPKIAYLIDDKRRKQRRLEGMRV